MGGTLKLRSISNHVEDLADGSIVAPGETVSLTEKQLSEPHNKRLVDEGLLIEAAEEKADSKEGR